MNLFPRKQGKDSSRNSRIVANVQCLTSKTVTRETLVFEETGPRRSRTERVDRKRNKKKKQQKRLTHTNRQRVPPRRR